MKETILEAGFKALQTFGPKNLTAPFIAKLTGIKQGHLTYYFPKRSQLFYEISVHAFKLLGQDIKRKLGKSTPFTDPTTLHQFLGWFLTSKKNSRLMMNVLYECEENPELHSNILQKIKDYKKSLSQTFDHQLNANEINIAMAFYTGIAVMNSVQGEESQNDLLKTIKEFETWLAEKAPHTVHNTKTDFSFMNL